MKREKKCTFYELEGRPIAVRSMRGTGKMKSRQLYLEEVLVRTPTGAFFTFYEYGEGGIMTNQKLKQDLTADEAREWLNKTDEPLTDEQKDLLIHPEQWDEPAPGRTQVNVMLCDEVIAKIKQDAEQGGVPFSHVLNELCKEIYHLYPYVYEQPDATKEEVQVPNQYLLRIISLLQAGAADG